MDAPDYLTDSESRITYDVPGRPGEQITGPGELDWDLSVEISSGSMVTDPETGAQRQDGAKFAGALTRHWLMHQDTTWNLKDRDGRPLEKDLYTIMRRLKPSFMGPLSMRLTEKLFPELYHLTMSAEGNVTQTPPIDGPSASGGESTSANRGSGRRPRATPSTSQS